jgi:hypothetical protein
MVRMNAKLRKIEVDAQTAELLEACASGRGMTVSELLADIARNGEILPADEARMRSRRERPWSAELLENDARRLVKFERARMGTPWAEVRVWLESWRLPHELPPPKSRKS